MEMKQLLKIAIACSLIFSLLTLVDQLLQYTAVTNSLLLTTFPIYQLFFVTVIIWSHKKYIKRKENAFLGIITLTICLILFSYCFEYLIKIAFYYLKNDGHNAAPKQRGLIRILTAFDKPSFSPIWHLLINPFQLIRFEISNLNFIEFYLAVINSKIILASIIIYFNGLFYVFQKCNKNGWHAIIPIKNNLTLLSIANKPSWWIILLYIPIVKRITLFFVNKSISEKCNMSLLFSVGMTLLPPLFYGKIGFDNNIFKN